MNMDMSRTRLVTRTDNAPEPTPPPVEDHAVGAYETITITFQTRGDAFSNSVTGEIEWILHDLASQFVQNGIVEVVMDSYGNTVGTVTVQPMGEDE